MTTHEALLLAKAKFPASVHPKSYVALPAEVLLLLIAAAESALASGGAT